MFASRVPKRGGGQPGARHTRHWAASYTVRESSSWVCGTASVCCLQIQLDHVSLSCDGSVMAAGRGLCVTGTGSNLKDCKGQEGMSISTEKRLTGQAYVCQRPSAPVTWPLEYPPGTSQTPGLLGKLSSVRLTGYRHPARVSKILSLLECCLCLSLIPFPHTTAASSPRNT